MIAAPALARAVEPAVPRFVLSRLRFKPYGTFGVLIDWTGAQIAVTLEPPNNGNKPGISCILAGDYVCARRWSDKHNCEVFGLLNVPGRDNVEIHPGCLWPRDTEGCVLTGTTTGYVDYDDGKPNATGDGILGAQTAFKRFMNLNEGLSQFLLRIVDPIATAIAD